MQQTKKSKKFLWISLAILVVLFIGAWCIFSAIKINGTLDNKGNVIKGINKALSIPALLTGIFIVTAVGYMFGRITIKGVSLGSAGVFIIAIVFGVICCFIPEDIPVLGAFSLKPVGNSTLINGIVKDNGEILNTLYSYPELCPLVWKAMPLPKIPRMVIQSLLQLFSKCSLKAHGGGP